MHPHAQEVGHGRGEREVRVRAHGVEVARASAAARHVQDPRRRHEHAARERPFVEVLMPGQYQIDPGGLDHRAELRAQAMLYPFEASRVEWLVEEDDAPRCGPAGREVVREARRAGPDPKSTRLNSSHLGISYAGL